MGRLLSNQNKFNDPIYLECECSAELLQIWPLDDGTTCFERWSAYKSPKPVAANTAWIQKILDSMSTSLMALPCLNIRNRYLVFALIDGEPKSWSVGLYKKGWMGKLRCLWEIISSVETISKLRDALHIQTPFEELDA